MTTIAAMLIGAVAGAGTWILSHSVEEWVLLFAGKSYNERQQIESALLTRMAVAATFGALAGLILVWLYRRLVRRNNRITIHLAEKVNELAELKRTMQISEAEYNHRKELLADY